MNAPTIKIEGSGAAAYIHIRVTSDTDGLASKAWVEERIKDVVSPEEMDPTVPEWAKQPKKPTYTAAEVGAQPEGDYALKSEIPEVPVMSVNGRTGAVELGAAEVGARPDTWTPTADDVGADPAGSAEAAEKTAKEYADRQIAAIPTPDVSGQIGEHNQDPLAHPAIREAMTELETRLNALADSDDTTLDQLSEIVAYIKSNKGLIDAITTSKVSVSDIVDSLTSEAADKPLSAKQGAALKKLIDAITVPTKVSELQNDAGYLTAVPGEYVTDEELDEKGYLTEHQDLSNYATKAYLEQYVNESILGGEW